MAVIANIVNNFSKNEIETKVYQFIVNFIKNNGSNEFIEEIINIIVNFSKKKDKSNLIKKNVEWFLPNNIWVLQKFTLFGFDYI